MCMCVYLNMFVVRYEVTCVAVCQEVTPACAGHFGRVLPASMVLICEVVSVEGILYIVFIKGEKISYMHASQLGARTME